VPWITSLATYLIDHLTSSVAAISKLNDSPLAKNWVAETADAGGQDITGNQ
jgi:hypothetical protein